MTQQLHLFDELTPAPARPRLRRPAAQRVSTSIEAAERIRPHVPGLQRLVLEFIESQGERGATRNEMAAALPIKLQTICGRANELLRAGLIWQCDDKRAGSKVLRADGVRRPKGTVSK